MQYQKHLDTLHDHYDTSFFINNDKISTYKYDVIKSSSTDPNMRYLFNSAGKVPLFVNTLSDLKTSVDQFSTSKVFVLSKEENFIKKNKLQDALQQAHLCASEIFGNPSTSLEYGKDSELEWLDFNLHYDSIDRRDIESLLDKIDELSTKFEEKVGINIASNFNFYLDIK